MLFRPESGSRSRPHPRGHRLTSSTQTALPAIPGNAVGATGQGIEEFDFGERFHVAVESYRLAHHFESLVHGEDMVKFHVRLSGRRLLTFDRHETLALESSATAVLLHERDMPKVDHILADYDEASVTVALKRERFLEYLDIQDTHVPNVLSTMMTRYARSPRLATAKPSRRELELARTILGAPPGLMRRMFVEAKSLELIHAIMERLGGDAVQEGSSVRLTEHDRRRLAEVRELLQSNVMQTLRIDALARRFGLNRNKLCTGFRTLFGVSIFDFALGHKMKEADRLLRESELTVMQIALSIGYTSAGAFSTAFHRHFGRSPRDIRALRSPSRS